MDKKLQRIMNLYLYYEGIFSWYMCVITICWSILFFKGCEEIGWIGMSQTGFSGQLMLQNITGYASTFIIAYAVMKKFARNYPITIAIISVLLDGVTELTVFYSMYTSIAINSTVSIFFSHLYSLQFTQRFNDIFCREGMSEIRTQFNIREKRYSIFSRILGGIMCMYVNVDIYQLVTFSIIMPMVLCTLAVVIFKMMDSYA